jgi:hypothetical protein
MSSITLSEPLIAGLRKVLREHDPNASDLGVTLQYLSAVTGFLLAGYRAPFEDKEELLDQLCAFTKQVFAERSLGGSRTASPQQEAFGIWRPGDP